MSYQLRLRRVSQKQLDKLSQQEYGPVDRVISSLEDERRPLGVKKLAIGGLWRLRAMDFRIICSIDDEKRQVTVVRVARRSERTYKGI